MKPKRATLWIIDNGFVMEPSVAGQQLGELPDFDVSGYELKHFTEAEFDAMCEEYRKEFGHYPDS